MTILPLHLMKLRPYNVLLLSLLMIMATAEPVSGQSSATIVKRLTDLEAKVTSLLARVEALETENAAQASKISALETQVASLETTQASQATTIASIGTTTLNLANAYTDSMTAGTLAQAKTYADGIVNPVNDKLIHFSRSGNEVYITGANVHIRNGTGYTYQNINGLGNLTIGYNDLRTTGNVRTGSHNLVLGFNNNYSAAGGIIDGAANTSSGHFASVLGGTGNTASGLYAVVAGGYNNVASGSWSFIGGGQNKVASSQLANLP